MKAKSPLPIVNPGYLYVMLAAILWATSGTAAKMLFSHGVSPFQLVQLRLGIASAFLFVWLALRRPALLRIARRDLLYFALLGGGALAAAQFTYLFAISRINVATAILLQYLSPTFIALYAAVFTREYPDRTTLTAILGAVAGCYLVVGAYDLDVLSLNTVGILSGLMSAATFAWYAIQGEFGMRRYPPLTVLFYALLFAFLTWNLLQPPLGAFFGPYGPADWGWILYIGVMGTLLPFGFFLQGVTRIRATRASITATLEPIAAAVISYFLLAEALSPLQLLGGALVIASVVLLQVRHELGPAAPGHPVGGPVGADEG
jgi:drug/metabolite transporter (DMT)-like permease